MDFEKTWYQFEPKATSIHVVDTWRYESSSLQHPFSRNRFDIPFTAMNRGLINFCETSLMLLKWNLKTIINFPFSSALFSVSNCNTRQNDRSFFLSFFSLFHSQPSSTTCCDPDFDFFCWEIYNFLFTLCAWKLCFASPFLIWLRKLIHLLIDFLSLLLLGTFRGGFCLIPSCARITKKKPSQTLYTIHVFNIYEALYMNNHIYDSQQSYKTKGWSVPGGDIVNILTK